MRAPKKLVILMVAAGGLAGCSDALVAPQTGALEVTTATSGEGLDADGYVVRAEMIAASPIGTAGQVTIEGLAPGVHEIELAAVALNCVVAGSNPRTVTIRAGTTTTLPFEVQCERPQPVSGRVAYWSGGQSPGIYLMNRDGSGKIRLGDGGEPAVSPDGAWILFVSNGDIHIMDSSGSRARPVTRAPDVEFRPRWSPDGRWVAFTRNLDIYVMRTDGSDPVNLTNHPDADNAASWSPDGSKIAFTSNRTGEFEIFVMNADGSNAVNLTNDPSRSDYGPAWSPDGEQIAYASDSGGVGEIFVMNADGSGRVNLTLHESHDTWPSWSPDGSQLTFTSRRTGTSQVFVMGADGSGQTNLSSTPGADHFAGFPQAWTP